MEVSADFNVWQNCDRGGFQQDIDKGIEASADFNVWQNCDRGGFQQGIDKGVKNSQHCEMGQTCGKNTSESLEIHQNSINLPLNTTKDQSVPERTEYDDYIVKQAKKLYKNQKVSPEEVNLRYDALKRKELFKTITDIKFNTFVAYRHLITIAITLQNDHCLNIDYYLKKYGLF